MGGGLQYHNYVDGHDNEHHDMNQHYHIVNDGWRPDEEQHC